VQKFECSTDYKTFLFGGGLMMEKLCIVCGNTSDDAEGVCVHCGAYRSAAIEALVSDDTNIVNSPVGTRIQPIVRVSYIIALINLIMGPASTFVAIFSPMLPYQIFQAVPFIVFGILAFLVPLIALVCLVLNKIAKRCYNPTEHAPKNHRFTLLSYRLSVLTNVLWFTVLIVGIVLTLI